MITLKVGVTNEYLVQKGVIDLNNRKPIDFLFKLENKFPFTFPRVYCVSNVTKYPNLSDGRDYIEDII